MQTLTELLTTFLKIGLFNFGGGYAMIPFLQAEATTRGWLTLTQFTDIVAISQITPGPVAVNMATFVGFRQAQLPGALLATFGVCMPSFIIMSILVRFFGKFGESPIVRRVFFGLRPAVLGLIFASAFLIARLEFLPQTSLQSLDIKAIFLSLACFAAMLRFKVSPLICIVCAAIAGVALF